jgi:hypothetical protein
MNDEKFQALIKSIPGEEGFYKYRAEIEYLTVGYKLLQLGLTEQAAVEILEGLYWTTAECYGGC